VRGEPDLSPQDERWLGEWAQQEHGSDFLFVTGYPMVKRPFYTHPDPARPAYSNSFDLLFRGTELVTGGQRLHRYADYLAALAKAAAAYRTVRELSGGVPLWHAAARRLCHRAGAAADAVAQLALPNVRLATLFPRDL
jgi:nondiscriminating aspartyl-tRNA synthetase